MSSSTSSNSAREYLGNYGVADAKREKRFFRTAAILVGSLLIGFLAWRYSRTFREERAVKEFFSLLEQKNYKAAYAKFGCTDAAPCRDYKFERFLEDWGDKSPYANVSAIQTNLAEPCGNTVWVSIQAPGQKELGLSVDPADLSVTFAPEARCPGVWRASEFPGKFMRFLKRKMS